MGKRRQGEGESVSDYAAAMRKLAMGAHPEEGDAARVLRNAAALKASTRGLNDVHLKVYVMDKKPDKLSTAITWAEQWIDLTQGNQQTNQIVAAAVSGDKKTSVTPGVDSGNRVQRNQRKSQSQVKKKETLYHMVKSLWDRSAAPNQQSGKATYLPRAGKNIVCWNCHKLGHIQRDCDKEERIVASEGQIVACTQCACSCEHEWLKVAGNLNM